MKILITIFGVVNGGYMLLDGLFVIFNGTYIGPEKPGPWANVFSMFNVDVFKLGPLFVFYGLTWLVWVVALWTQQSWAYSLGVILSILTLWYLPVGTLFSLIILIVLLTTRVRLGL